jgi:hypothetical protein
MYVMYNVDSVTRFQRGNKCGKPPSRKSLVPNRRADKPCIVAGALGTSETTKVKQDPKAA